MHLGGIQGYEAMGIRALAMALELSALPMSRPMTSMERHCSRPTHRAAA